VATPVSELPASTNPALSASVNPPQDLANDSAPPASEAPEEDPYISDDASLDALEPASNSPSSPPQAPKETDVLLTSTNRFGITWAGEENHRQSTSHACRRRHSLWLPVLSKC
jgi:hypothetical protein